ncbi:Retrovirus-related Pol polyprotein from type-1 retrotransposable element R1 [Araneus ventricosus]|uniref:Retrovirus-related Pol polyprotein from type-1 retrotransposable element R1 n=1 Tax=Araneus ventricosus TaxID=182803 RepID=A0A4Y2BD40_ARAVE|nr:Retrovirus-related Pol polyprotein from type-1 retrotransposable element R1 [Araneus ventricosus]
MQTSEGPVLWEQTQGWPQGSCSGPAFWNIMAGEIISVQWPQGVHLQAFADDFALIATDNTREGLRKLSKLALDKFKECADKNKLHVSMEKSSYILFSKLVRGPTIKWGNQSISRKNHLKYLGVTIDHKLSWQPHVIDQGKRAMDQYQNLCRIAGKTWGINKNIRRLLYKTVIERTLCHGAAAWGHNMTSRIQKKLDSIQRLFLLYITGAYRTTPTAALQVITCLQPLHQQIQQNATYSRVARARSSSNFFTVIFSPTDYECKRSGIHIHPPNFLLHNQISFAENHIDSGAKAIYTDGSKTDEGTGSAYCILENYGIIASWQRKLDRSHSVFQAEILAIRMAIEAASSLLRPIKILTDSMSSLMAMLNPKSHHNMVREIQTLLLSHKHIHLRWLKAHVGYLDNECADQLAKEAITKGDPFFLPKPLFYLKSEIKSAALSI